MPCPDSCPNENANLISPPYTVHIVPTSQELPGEWTLLTNTTYLRSPFILKWNVTVETAVSPTEAKLENAEDALRKASSAKLESDQTDSGSEQMAKLTDVIDHFQVRLAGPDSAEAAVVETNDCHADLTAIWDKLKPGIIRFDIVALDSRGVELGSSLVNHFVKESHPADVLTLPPVQLAPGGRTNAIIWDAVEGALLRHIRPFVVTPRIANTLLNNRTAKWKIQIAHLGGCETVESDGKTDTVDVAGIWDKIDPGPYMLRIQALDAEGDVIALSTEQIFKKAPDFKAEEQPKPNCSQAIRKISNYLINLRAPKTYEPNLPPYRWHSSINEWGDISGSSYPSQFEVGVEAWLLRNEWEKKNNNDAEADLAISQAREMVDFILEHKTPANWAYPNLPATTLTKGQIGGHQEGNSISLPGVATVARMFVWMYQRLDENKYLDAAMNVARQLLELQNDDGSWPWRIKPQSGEPDYGAMYTSQIIEIVRLYDLVNEIQPNESFAAAAKAGLNWLINNPVKTNRWEGYYIDDPGGMALYSGVSHLDAVWTAKYFLANRNKDESYLSLAKNINDWVEDHFIIFARETHWGNSSIISTEPVTPAIIEKPFYQRTVTGHTANWIGLLLGLYEATNDKVYFAKAVAGCNAMLAAILPNGGVVPESPDMILHRRPAGESLWFWNAWSVMKGLLEFELFCQASKHTRV